MFFFFYLISVLSQTDELLFNESKMFIFSKGFTLMQQRRVVFRVQMHYEGTKRIRHQWRGALGFSGLLLHTCLSSLLINYQLIKLSRKRSTGVLSSLRYLNSATLPRSLSGLSLAFISLTNDSGRLPHHLTMFNTITLTVSFCLTVGSWFIQLVYKPSHIPLKQFQIISEDS